MSAEPIGPRSEALPEIGAHADAAMRAVRLLVAVLACVVLGAYRPLVEGPSWWSLGGSLALIIAITVILNAASGRIGRRQPWVWVIQAADQG